MVRNFDNLKSRLIALAAVGFILCTLASGKALYANDHLRCLQDLHGVELAASTGYVQLENNRSAFGLDIHLTKRLTGKGISHHFALGLMSKIIFAENEHYGAMVSFTAFPWRGLVLGVAPGIEWGNHGTEREAQYATHFEAAYAFQIGDYEIGPVVDYSRSGEGQHYIIGLHFGLHF